MDRRISAAVALVFAALIGLAPSAATGATPTSSVAGRGCSLPVFGPGASYHPKINPADFSANVDNPMFPLTPGTTLVYSGTKDGKQAIDLFAPSQQTAVIDGVTTRIVQDRGYLNGLLEERTSDYYAQDRCGNVWYFGEDTATLDKHGNVISTEGSFHAGVDGAQPGVFMQAQPQVDRRFRQEWYSGHAEDTFKAIDLSTPISVPYGSFENALLTEESTALEPAVLDNKYYVQGIGEVEELAVKGPLEKFVLIDILR